MEILSNLLLLATAVVIFVYVAITESTDWIGRAEVIEKRWPSLWSAMNNRPARLVFSVVGIGMLARLTQDFRTGCEAPPAIFRAPPVPTIDSNLKVVTV